MYKDKVVLCGASAYEQKYYFNDDFASLPQSIQMCIRDRAVDFAPQPVITKDNVTMRIDTVVFFQITDPRLFTYGIDNPIKMCIRDRGKTEGVFQLESAGMTSFMKELKPESLGDVIAGISLYRPGPMDFIPQYLEGKNNPDRCV